MSPPVIAADCSHTGRLARHSRALKLALGVTIAFMLAEAAGGLLANSLALLADAGHMLGDAASLGLSLFVAWVAQRPATPTRTYGYLRLEIFAALINGSALFVIAGLIVWQALSRLAQPPAVRPGLMLVVAGAGLLANLVALRLLHAGHDHSLNVRGAYLHVLGDLLGSVGALGAAAIIALTGWSVVDPVISIGIALLVLAGAWRLVRESVDVLLESTPRHIPLADVERELASIPGVTDIHDLHVWTVTSGVVAMTGHAVVADPSHSPRVLAAVERRMAGFGIHHVTMQLETARSCREPGAASEARVAVPSQPG
jgi:cobalt-zinc-cadmium efflux system protein